MICALMLLKGLNHSGSIVLMLQRVVHDIIGEWAAVILL